MKSSDRVGFVWLVGAVKDVDRANVAPSNADLGRRSEPDWILTHVPKTWPPSATISESDGFVHPYLFDCGSVAPAGPGVDIGRLPIDSLPTSFSSSRDA